MPEVKYETVLNLPPDKIWDFVKDMNNWAPFVTGYQKHEEHDERHSVWTLKGDVGMLSRQVDLDVHITEWLPEQKVEFTLKGLNENVEGGGTFAMSSFRTEAQGQDADADAGVPEPVPETKKPRRSLWKRFWSWFFRRSHRKKFGVTDRVAPKLEDLRPNASRLSFRLEMTAGGPMGPMVNALLEPALEPAAEELGQKVAQHLEELHGVSAAAA